jgi:cell wall-associated NlpC family hydrolase
MDVIAQRARVVAEARQWLFTPYHPCAGLRGVGVDCGQLLVRVYVDCGLVAPFETGPYPQDWHMHRDEERYLAFVESRMAEIAGAPEAGDAMLFCFGRCYSHGAIVSRADPLTVIHAWMPSGRVLEEPLRRDGLLLAPKFGRKPPRTFTLWPKA